jgi:ATP-dependent Lon protease
MNHTKPLLNFILDIKRRFIIRNNIYQEVTWLFDICQDISSRIGALISQNIFNKTYFKESLSLITDILVVLKDFNKPITISSLNQRHIYIVALKLSKIRLNLTRTVQDIGCLRINNITKLFLNISYSELQYQSDQSTILDIMNRYFNPISCDMYQLTEDSSYSLVSDDGESLLNTKLTEPKITKPTLAKLSPFTRGLTLRHHGCKFYLPRDTDLLVISGYFDNDYVTCYQCYPVTNTKYDDTRTMLATYNIPIEFQTNYLNQISLQQIMLFNPNEIADEGLKRYEELKKLRSKSISNLIKDFVSLELELQRDVILNFLLAGSDIHNIYLALILIDLLHQEHANNGSKVSDQIYQSFHWNQQQLINPAKPSSLQLENDFSKYSEEAIPLEKRILLMKCHNNTKSKAFEKLKEVNSGKGGESSSKAQQYIEGLLKIPFGIFRTEPILDKLPTFQQRILNLCNKYPVINQKIGTLKENMNCIDISVTISTISKLIYTISPDTLVTALSSKTCPVLRNILGDLGISKQGVKKTLLQKIITHSTEYQDSITVELLQKYNIYTIHLPEGAISNINSLQDEWNEYQTGRQDFLQISEKTLDRAVYGMKEAKLDITRIIAQWINGSNEGYILGFEGPPGTGKTTLAKQGISKCLSDENGNPRPFTFIALGGSTNGSTLEGHNYTYVGSTWGRIVDALMEAKCMNPIIYIDELDKISKTEHGKEIIGILIHLTDPSQNTDFMDKYFAGIQIDISKCLIIFSYNDPSLIDKVLLDRIHRIQVGGLNRHEKCHVAKLHLIPEISKTVGFNTDDLILDDSVIYYIIDNYTFEAGARKLKERLFDIIREINLQVILGKYKTIPIEITQDMVKQIFDKRQRMNVRKIPTQPAVGLVNGLYATSNGTGGITIIEAFKYLSESRLSLELTGQQGDVMKESMRVSKTVAWNLLPDTVKDKIRKDDPFGIHVHCPEAAQPKDGPSAGTAITIAILSQLSNIPVNNEIAVTGEIDLNGNVLAIGGLESKLEGAKFAGVKTVLCPKENADDLALIRKSDNPPENDDFKVITISNIHEAIGYFLLGNDGMCDVPLFQNYAHLSLSHNDYLQMFKNVCDVCDDLITIIDTTSNYNILYTSKGFGDKLGWPPKETYGKSIIDFIQTNYKTSLEKTIQDTMKGQRGLCCRLKIYTKGDEEVTMTCSLNQIDNIISLTMRMVAK